MTFYYLQTNRPYFTVHDKYCFMIEERKNVPKILDDISPNFKKRDVLKCKYDGHLSTNSGIYVITITNQFIGWEDFAYIGSSINLHNRINQNLTLKFLKHCCVDFLKVNLYTLDESDFKTVEKKLISELTPFLNIADTSKRHLIEFSIKKNGN